MTITNKLVNYEYDHTIGMDDFAGRAFRNLSDLAVTDDGVLFVLQRGESVHNNPSVKICTVDEEWIGEFGDYGQESGQLMWPCGIAISNERAIYVTDEWNQKVLVFDMKGSFISQWGTKGSGNGEFDSPSGIAFEQSGNLLIIDARNNRIQRFTSKGEYINAFGSHGTGAGEFNMPWGVAVNHLGEIYVSDWRNDRIQKFSSDGEYILEWGEHGSSEGQFNRPAGLCVDGDGWVYVADWHNDRVQIFDAEGSYLDELNGDATMSKWGAQLLEANPLMEGFRQTAKYPELEGKLYRPRSVRSDTMGRIFIVDSCKGRLQIYKKM